MFEPEKELSSGKDGPPPPRDRVVPAGLYDREYFLSNCGGFREFLDSRGMRLPERLSVALEAAGIGPGMRVADIGCGRGEAVIRSALAGAEALGVDYSGDAIALAREAAAALPPEAGARVNFVRADVAAAELGEGVFDVVLMTDIVEHLYPKELSWALGKVLRALKPGGRLIVHTAPNIWYTRYGWVVLRRVIMLKEFLLRTGNRVPVIHPSMTGINEKVHVNLQSPRGLRRTLESAGFSGISVFFRESGPLEGESAWNGVLNRLFLLPGLEAFFRLSIFALARKPGPGPARGEAL
ncbi:MAG: class I SAM-dependent methyltransferase [Elusimicrobia bacterium]|nr:class I SAM-dependent methyltransferase [Elusimicrobiota bacterium]